MSLRAELLADRIEKGAQALASFAEGLADEDWKRIVPNEQRSVGVLVHHVASVYQVEIDLTRGLASGNPIVGVTWEVIDHMNANHAEDHASPDQTATIDMLRQNSKTAADAVRKFTDEELDSAARVTLNADAPLTAQYFIEDHALRHSFHHLANIKAALNP